jgi:hypothetical protein
MITKEHEPVFKRLLDNYCLFLVQIEFVESVHDWCRQQGVEEPDRQRPMKLVVNEDRGCRMVINENVPDRVVNDRIKALSVRSALTNVASNKAERLDSDKKKLAYLFLGEYAATLPGMEDEILADEWVFGEMEKLGFFNE